jgi:Ca2+-binding EF-hand superfamily protein
MLGWRQKLLHKFWEVFMNASDGTETINFDSFTKNFGFNKSDYGVENCFRYFNITRNGEIDFLEFMIGAWNMCPENIDTLVRFAFDMYDVDDDFELSIPNIEKIPVSKEIIHDMIAFTEERGGALDLESFAFYCVEHSHILLPIFIIQRVGG